MNQRTPGLKLSKAIPGFLQYKAAEALSPRTLECYEQHLHQWLEYAGDVEVIRITTQDLRAYLAWLRTDYKPRRLTGGDQPLVPKTIRNYWVTLSAFFTWATVEFELPNPMKAVPAPKFEEAPVQPFTKEEIEVSYLSAILKPGLRIITAQVSFLAYRLTGRNHGPTTNDDFGADRRIAVGDSLFETDAGGYHH